MGLFALVVVVLTIATIAFLLAWELTHPTRRTAAYAIVRGLPVDPAEDGIAFEEWTLHCPDGVTLPVWEIPSGVDGSDSVTLVAIHDHGESRIDAFARLRGCSPPGVRLVCYDRRGHGEATGIARLGAKEGADLIGLVERLRGSIVLIGWGSGAAIARHAASAIASKSRLAGVAMFDPGAATATARSLIDGELRRFGLPKWLHSPVRAALFLAGVRMAGDVPSVPREIPTMQFDSGGIDGPEAKTPGAAHAAIRGFLDQVRSSRESVQSIARSV